MYEEMEMPTPCQRCGNWFDLNDGYRSDKWYPNTVICKTCHEEEEKEIEMDEEIQDLKNQYADALFTIKECKRQLKEFGLTEVQKVDQYNEYCKNGGSMSLQEWDNDGRYDPSLFAVKKRSN